MLVMTPDASPLSLLRNSAANFANTNCTVWNIAQHSGQFRQKLLAGTIDDSRDGDDNIALRDTVVTTK